MARVTPPIRHTFKTTQGLPCDGRKCFEVLIRKKRMGDEVRYWCDAMHGYFDPFHPKCPKGGTTWDTDGTTTPSGRRSPG